MGFAKKRAIKVIFPHRQIEKEMYGAAESRALSRPSPRYCTVNVVLAPIVDAAPVTAVPYCAW